MSRQFHEIFNFFKNNCVAISRKFQYFIFIFILGCDQVIASGSSTTPESLNAMTALTLLKGSQPKQVFDEYHDNIGGNFELCCIYWVCC